MKHEMPTRAWRPMRARSYHERAPQGVLTAFVFNLCLFFLPIATGAAFLIIHRDQLYAYEYSDAGARAVSARVERLNGNLIQLDFDRLRQWDDLVAMELMAGDVSAARGFLLSARAMAPGGATSGLNRARNDAELEMLALELLTPGTRSRYESTVPLLSRRSSSGEAQRHSPEVTLGDQRDFELLSRSMISESDPDMLQFVLTGLGLGLAGEISPQTARGAAVLVAASRSDGFPAGLETDLAALLARAAPLEAFRNAALAGAPTGDAASFANAANAFRESIVREPMSELATALADIGQMADATSLAGAAYLLSHASSLQDLPKLKLLAQAAGDRASAAAKRLPRDGQLLLAARGELTMNRDLAGALAAAALALAGLLSVIGLMTYRLGRRLLSRVREDDYSGELVDISANNWRPL